jgi:hypothetical protein
MKNEQQNTQQNTQQQTMPWPEKNEKQQNAVAADNQSRQIQSMPWPEKNKQEAEPPSDNAGNGMSIGTDPGTVKKDKEADNITNRTPEQDPEINTPVYDPGKTAKKIPVMKTDLPE